MNKKHEEEHKGAFGGASLDPLASFSSSAFATVSTPYNNEAISDFISEATIMTNLEGSSRYLRFPVLAMLFSAETFIVIALKNTN